MTDEDLKPDDEQLPPDAEISLDHLGDDEEEFSLEKLSQAYSKILSKNRGAESTPEADVAADEEIDKAESSEVDTLNDVADNAGATINEQSIIEAILFVGVPDGEKLTAKKIASSLRDVSPKEVKKIIDELNKRYEQEKSPYVIEQADSSYRMALRDSFKAIREKFYGEIREAQLNQFAIDILSIVAYQQPISRNDLDKIRQRPSGSLLNQLVERQLLMVDPASPASNKCYRTTDRFLELFGLSSIEDLPLAHEVDDINEFFDDILT
ncbi:MAG: SMC-Scp complex subunit ScpB [Pirellulaceae bacterium]